MFLQAVKKQAGIVVLLFGIGVVSQPAPAGQLPDMIWMTGGHNGCSPVFLTPDEEMLISRGGEKLWRLKDGALAGVHAPVSSGRALSPDGVLIAGILSNNAFETWSVVDGQVRQTFHGHSDLVMELAFSRDGSLVASASRDRSVKLWSVAGGLLRTMTGHTGMTRAVAFSPDGALLASGSQDKSVRLWRVSDGAHLRTLSGHTEYVGSVTFSPNGSHIATTSGDKTVRLWRTSDGALLHTLVGHDWSSVDAEFTPDGEFVVSTGIDWTLRVWRVSDGAMIRTIDVGAYGSSLAMFADGEHVAVGTDDNPRVFRLLDGAEVSRLGVFTQPVTSVVASHDGRRVFAAEPDTLEQRLHMLNAKTGEVVRTLTIGEFGQEEIAPLAVASDDAFFVTRNAGGQEIYIRSMQDGALIRTLTGHVSVIYELAVSHDRSYIASAGEYQSGLWRVSDGERIRFFEDDFGVGFHAVAFSPDDSVVAAGALGEGRIWNVNDGSLVAAFDHPEAFFVDTVAFSPDGGLLASGGSGGSIKLFDAQTGDPVRTLAGHQGDITRLVFSQDGRRVFSSGLDARIRIWNVQTGAMLYDLDQGLGRRVRSVALLPGERSFVFSNDDVFVGLARNPLRKPVVIPGSRIDP